MPLAQGLALDLLAREMVLFYYRTRLNSTLSITSCISTLTSIVLQRLSISCSNTFCSPNSHLLYSCSRLRYFHACSSVFFLLPADFSFPLYIPPIASFILLTWLSLFIL